MSLARLIILETIDWGDVVNKNIELFSIGIALNKTNLRPQFPLIIEQTAFGRPRILKIMSMFVSDNSARDYINNDLVLEAIADDLRIGSTYLNSITHTGEYGNHSTDKAFKSCCIGLKDAKPISTIMLVMAREFACRQMYSQAITEYGKTNSPFVKRFITEYNLPVEQFLEHLINNHTFVYEFMSKWPFHDIIEYLHDNPSIFTSSFVFAINLNNIKNTKYALHDFAKNISNHTGEIHIPFTSYVSYCYDEQHSNNSH